MDKPTFPLQPNLFAPRPVKYITTLLGGLPEAEDMLKQHGCIIDKIPEQDMYDITLPTGAMREPIDLATLVVRYWVTLPDGFRFKEVFDVSKMYSLLYFFKEDVEKYRK